MKLSSRRQGERSWPKSVFKKWLNIPNHESDYSADEGDNESDFDDDEGWDNEMPGHGNQAESAVNNSGSKLRRRNSETLRAQYIDTKELRVCVGTWNVGGKLPSDDLDVDEWLDTREPADIYVLGMQEIVPLNAGNIFGAEDSRPVHSWECLIRDALDRVRPAKPKYKSFSDPPTPSRFRPADDAHSAPETDSDTDDEESVSLADDGDSVTDDSQRQSPMKRLQRLNHFASSVDEEAVTEARQKMLTKSLSSSERIGLVWPEQSLDLMAKNRLQSVKSFRACASFKSVAGDSKGSPVMGLIPECNWERIVSKRRSPFVRVASKKMVGVFLSIWVRRSLRKYIQNLKVSTVGVGLMGYIGNKGSVSVSMSIYQTPFCFICTHLSSGEKSGDDQRRNADVQEIHRRTRFNTASGSGHPQTILEHERIFWLGDLNYRINLPYERAHELIAKKKWPELAEKDQLTRELRKGRAFDGWSEGIIRFPPTYKYEFNSEKYIGDDLKGGRRTPAWCDRILSYGTGMKLVNYRRSELKLSDHRPVTATFMAEVEVFSHRKLQRALTLTDAEVEDGEIISDIDITGMGRLRVEEEFFRMSTVEEHDS